MGQDRVLAEGLFLPWHRYFPIHGVTPQLTGSTATPHHHHRELSPPFLPHPANFIKNS